MIRNSLFDLIICNADVRHPRVKACASQTDEQIYAVIKVPETHLKVPLNVTLEELLRSSNVTAVQNSAPTLANIRKLIAEGVCRTGNWGTTRFYRNGGKLYREAAMEMGHYTALGGHMGRQKS